jgi:hypothetical protein
MRRFGEDLGEEFVSLVELVDAVEADDDGVDFGHGHGEAEGLGAFVLGFELAIAVDFHADDAAAFFAQLFECSHDGLDDAAGAGTTAWVGSTVLWQTEPNASTPAARAACSRN